MGDPILKIIDEIIEDIEEKSKSLNTLDGKIDNN
jgi:hypothetical protein